MLSIRYVIERFAEKGRTDGGNGDIGGAFTGMMDETLLRLVAMTKTVGEGAFEIAYQRICRSGHRKDFALRGAGALQPTPRTPVTTVKFIEALGIADAFDLAVDCQGPKR